LPAQLIFFRLLAADQAEWASPDGRTQRGALSELAAVVGNARQIMVVPGEVAILHQVLLPSRKRSTWAKAIPYALEDQLAEDLEDVHLILGNAPHDGRLPVAVVSHQTMRDWLDSCAQNGLSPTVIIQESLLVPWQPGQWSLLVENQRAIVRTGLWSGFSTEQDTLGLFVAEALSEAGDAKPERLRIWCTNQDEFALPPALAEMECQIANPHVDALQLLATTYQPGVALNLLQGSYSRQAPWGRWLAPLRATAVLAGLWLLLQGGAYVYESWQLRQESVRLHAEMEQIYKDAVPGATRIPNPRAQLETRLRELRATGAAGSSFIELLSQGGQPLRNHPEILLRGFNYRDGQLDVSLQGGDPAALDKLQQQLNQQPGLQTEMRTTQREGQLESKVTLKIPTS
jgi:general secretion pathway protein L